MTRPYGSDPYERRPASSRSFLPLLLITLGVVFLLGNWIPDRDRGALVVLGLGVAFLIGRVTTGRYGYAVPAGILIAIGGYLGLQDVPMLRDTHGPGVFFLLLGFGFALTYVIGSRPMAIWPLFPACMLTCLGIVLFGAGLLAPLAALSWIAGYWPVALVLVGAWLIFRDHLPIGARQPIATLGGLALLCYGVVAAAATVASAGTFARPGAMPTFGSAPFNDTISMDQPIAAGQTFTVTNNVGRTTVHGGTGSAIHVLADRHFSSAAHAPEVHLRPVGNGVQLDASSGEGFPFGASWVEYTIDVPSGVNVSAHATSGSVSISGISGSVQTTTSSGSVDLTNIGGEVRANASSGHIRGTQLVHVRDVSTNSGSISLDALFHEAAALKTASGSVAVKLLPGSAVTLDVKTGSGSVIPSGLALSGGVTQRDRLSGALGSPAPGATLSIQTSSGSVTIGP